MKAIGKNLLINPIIERDKATESGFILHQKDREDIRYLKGEVYKTGNEVVGVKDGDIIYFDKHAGFKLELEEKEYRVITDSSIVVVL
jgi:co-chaperonin GroES (HSP10)